MSSIKGVVFDMGGTLLDYGGLGHWEDALQAAYRGVYRELAGAGYRAEFPAFRQLFWTHEDGVWRAATAGEATPTLTSLFTDFLPRVLPARSPTDGLDGTAKLVERCAAAYCRELQRFCEVFPGAAETLAELKRRGLRLGLVSNTVMPGAIHVQDLERFGLAQQLDDLVFSGDVGLWKPQPTVFQHSLDRLGLRPEEAVFVGDRLIDDVGGAQGVGLRGVLVKLLAGDGPDYAAGVARGIVPDGLVTALAELPALIDSFESDGKRVLPAS